MAQKYQYELTIQTKATGEGARQTERDLIRLGRAQDQINQMGTPEKLRVQEWAFYDLNEAITKTTNTSEKLPPAMDKTQTSTRNAGMAVLQFSQAFEDAQYGIRGVVNNIPGLVMSLGGGMGLAGVVSVGAVVISQLVERLGLLGKSTKDVSKEIEEAARAAGEALEAQLDKGMEARRRADESRRNAARPDTAAQQAEDAAYNRREENIAALIRATNLLNELMGRQVAASEQIAAAEAAKAAEIRRRLEREVELEERKVEAAREAWVAAKDMELSRLRDLGIVGETLKKEEAALAAARARKEELEAIANLPLPPAVVGDPTMAAGAQAMRGEAQRSRAKAQSALNDPKIEEDIKVAEARVEKAEETFKRLDGALVRYSEAVEQAELDFQRQAAASAQTVAGIRESMEEVAEQAGFEGQRLEAAADTIRKAVESVEASGAELGRLEQGALANLKEVLADDRVTADELQKASLGLTQLRSSFRVDVKRIVDLQAEFMTLTTGLESRLLRLERDVSDAKRRISQTRTPGNTN